MDSMNARKKVDFNLVTDLVPNIVSFLNLFTGFFSMILVSSGNYSAGAWLIVVAACFDYFDGYLARKLDLASDLGKQMDSFADLVSFVVAPSFLAVKVILEHMETWFVFIGFFYLTAGVYRLARFNVGQAMKNYFEGLPSTSAGIIVAMVVLACKSDSLVDFPLCSFLLAVFMVGISFLMVSKIPYPKISALKSGRFRPVFISEPLLIYLGWSGSITRRALPSFFLF